MAAPLTLEQALIRYDRLQSSKRYYNHYALGRYLQRADEVMAAVKNGADLRSEVCAAFSDRLRDYVLKQMDLAPVGERSTSLTYNPSR
jgi:hypothetical protein